jgi:hypothetical protein
MLIEGHILKRLAEFEKEHAVTVLLAVESGSRGWGFSSEDSDYDVRFVYRSNSLASYLTLSKPKDSFDWIEQENNCDFEGYDIYKFYDLLLKSNMNIIDWLFQSNIYVDGLPSKEELKAVVKNGFNRRTYISHNYGLCKKNYHRYFVSPAENEPTAKRFVYCIRALLSAAYCARFDTVAPLNFYDLLRASDLSREDKLEIIEMVEEKKRCREKKGYSNPRWKEFILSSLDGKHFEGKENDFPTYYAELNTLLLKTVMQVR